MELEQITELMSKPEKLIDPSQINTLSSYLNGFITDFEEQLWEDQLRASNKKLELYDVENRTNGQAETMWKVTEEFGAWKKTERLVRQLKRLRGDLKDRMNILMGKQRY